MKNYTYRLIEIRDEMEKTITNVENIVSQQKTLIEVVTNSDKKDTFTEFVSGLEQSNDRYFSQIERLVDKKNRLNVLIDKMKDENIADIVSEALELFITNFAENSTEDEESE